MDEATKRNRETLKAVQMSVYRVGDADIPKALEKVQKIVGDYAKPAAAPEPETQGRKKKDTETHDRMERGGRDRAE